MTILFNENIKLGLIKAAKIKAPFSANWAPIIITVYVNVSPSILKRIEKNLMNNDENIFRNNKNNKYQLSKPKIKIDKFFEKKI